MNSKLEALLLLKNMDDDFSEVCIENCMSSDYSRWYMTRFTKDVFLLLQKYNLENENFVPVYAIPASSEREENQNE